MGKDPGHFEKKPGHLPLKKGLVTPMELMKPPPCFNLRLGFKLTYAVFNCVTRARTSQTKINLYRTAATTISLFLQETV